MRLAFKFPYLSISGFEDIELPKFTIITGLNGSGKTHLLKAILENSIEIYIDGTHINNSQIKFFDFNNFPVAGLGRWSSRDQGHTPEFPLSLYSRVWCNSDTIEPLRKLMIKWGISIPPEDHRPTTAISLLEAYKSNFISDEKQHSKISDEVKKAKSECSLRIEFKLSPPLLIKLRAISNKYQKEFSDISNSILIDENFNNENIVDLFSLNFSSICASYRDRKLRNEIIYNRYNRGDLTTKPLNDDEFIVKFGPDPCALFNECLEKSGVSLYIDPPDYSDYSDYAPVYRSRANGNVIHDQHLSSGEKILVGLAQTIYNISEERNTLTIPKVLLLDEIDASLHPSMAKKVMGMIENFFVNYLGICVIFTTHSPSNVALAKEDSIFIMERNIALKKSSKQIALNNLTEGVPTIAIDYDGRRQVMTESNEDAKIYDKLFRILAPRFNSDRSLQFFAAGNSENGGKSLVKKVISEVSSSGNRSLFGIIDHDGCEKSKSNLFVLGDGERDGIENYIYDPLIVSALLVHSFPTVKANIPSLSNLSLTEFYKLSPDKYQEIVDQIQSKVFPMDKLDRKFTVKYFGGLNLDIANIWLETDDHDIEELIISTFPEINSHFHSKIIKLKLFIVDTILADKFDFIPLTLANTLRAILDAPAH